MVLVVIAAAMGVNTLFSKIPTGLFVCHNVLRHGQSAQVCVDTLRWRFSWDVVGKYIFDGSIYRGLWLTLELTVLAMLIGITLGVITAVMRLSPNRIVSSTAWLFTWFFRGTPVYVQILFWFNIAILYPTIQLGVPFGPHFLTIDVLTLFTGFVAALTALGLNEGAYMSEIVRAGFKAVDEGQIEAAQALGMTRIQTMWRITLPQAMRVIIPPTGNELISMLKTSSLASAIAVTELLKSTSNIANRTFQTMQLLIVASLWYLAVTTVLSIGQYYVERHFAKGSTRSIPPTPWQRVKADFRRLGLGTRGAQS
jgi:polar amino acid transport system permease protein